MKVDYGKGLRLIRRFVKEIWPKVDYLLDKYKKILQPVEGSLLATQALSSIENKRFHAIGGCVFALYPGANANSLVKLIVALQTISDYLDNLCDRAGVSDEKSFRQLHLAMLEAVDPSASISDYYLNFPEKNDNGYLKTLVETCREELKKLPSYALVSERVIKLVGLYSCLQVYKHLDLKIREARLSHWAEDYLKDYPDIGQWEFSAAAGSTLGIFILFAASGDPYLTSTEVELIYSAYFPYIAGLHILLDYYIDSDEDCREGDLNFTSYYRDGKETTERISYFIMKSFESCQRLRYPLFHLTVARGVLAMYLTDAKAFSDLNRPVTRKLIKKGGKTAMLYFHLCRLLRKKGML